MLAVLLINDQKMKQDDKIMDFGDKELILINQRPLTNLTFVNLHFLADIYYFQKHD